MIRTLLFALFLVGSLLLSSSSSFALYRIGHPQFVNLSHQEKTQLVQEIMKVVVELESRYRHEAIKSPHPSRLKKFTLLFNRLQNLLMEEARADGSPEWRKNLVNFSALLKEPNRCLYGGWISQLNSKGLCTHPVNLPRTSDERKAYNTGCEEPGQISCNPIIFGYKKISDHSPLCVSAGPAHDNANNASLHCMEKALASPNEGDKKETRLAYLVGVLSKNKNLAKELFDFIATACLCSPGPKNLNPKYQEYMQPHRTCYGLMKMVAEVTSSCPQPIVEESSVKLFKDLQSKIVADFSTPPANFDTLYSGFLIDVSSTDEFKGICKGATTISDSSATGNDASGSQSGSPGQQNQSGQSSGNTTNDGNGNGQANTGSNNGSNDTANNNTNNNPNTTINGTITTNGNGSNNPGNSTNSDPTSNRPTDANGSLSSTVSNRPQDSGNIVGNKTPDSGNLAGDKTPDTGKLPGDKAPNEGNIAGDKTPTNGNLPGDKTPNDGNIAYNKTPGDGNIAGGKTQDNSNVAGDRQPSNENISNGTKPDGSLTVSETKPDGGNGNNAGTDAGNSNGPSASTSSNQSPKPGNDAPTTNKPTSTNETNSTSEFKLTVAVTNADATVGLKASSDPAAPADVTIVWLSKGTDLTKIPDPVALEEVKRTPGTAAAAQGLKAVKDVKDDAKEKRYPSLTGWSIQAKRFTDDYDVCAKLVRGDTQVSDTVCNKIEKKTDETATNGDSATPSIKLTSGKPTDENVTVTAKVTGVKEGEYSVYWFNKKPEAAIKTSLPGSAGSVKEDSSEAKPNDGDMTVAKLLNSNNGISEISSTSNEKVNVKREKEDYQVCAYIKKGEKLVGASDCVTIDKLKEAKKPTQKPGGYFPPMNPGMMMQPSRTGGDLILRGVN